MLILVPILIYLTITICLIWMVNFSYKEKTELARKRIKKWMLGISIVLFFPLCLFYLSYLFGIATDNHYDVKKGTFLWFVTMDNKTITNFPVFEFVGKVTFNSIGGDSPNIATGWEIEYESTTDEVRLTEKLIHYLKSEGYEIKAVDKTQFYWTGRYEKNETNQLFSGSNDKGESLDLLLQKQRSGMTKIVCSIVY